MFDTKLGKAFAIIVLIISIAYWISAFAVSLEAMGFCEKWSCTPPAHYLPWPWSPEICGDMVVPMAIIDRVVCFLNLTGLFVLVVIAEVLLAAWLGKKLEDWIGRRRDT